MPTKPVKYARYAILAAFIAKLPSKPCADAMAAIFGGLPHGRPDSLRRGFLFGPRGFRTRLSGPRRPILILMAKASAVGGALMLACQSLILRWMAQRSSVPYS
jgi:hypothetical protein